MNRAKVLSKKRTKTKHLKEIITKALDILGFDKTYVTLYLTDDEEIRVLNKTYRKKDKPTDILSFLINQRMRRYNYLGELVISLDRALAQAREFGHSLDDELKRLIVHGIVHLYGLDHEKSKEEDTFFKEKESFILNNI